MLTRRHFIATGAAGVALGATGAGAQSDAGSYVVPRQHMPRYVKVRPGFQPNTIHIDLGQHALYWITAPEEAIRYTVAIGEEGRNLKGSATVKRKVEWPGWTPTKSMIEREPEVYKKWEDGMEGGPENPLGARALYLYRNGKDTLYRIHGTPQPWSVGRSVSSGCIRLINSHVIDLYKRVPIGTQVTVHHPQPVA